MDVDPLYKVKSANFDHKISNHLYNLIIKRFSIVKERIKHIERITNIKFPFFYIEPNLIVSYSQIEFSEYGILYARTIPIVDIEGKLDIVVQITAALIAYGQESSIFAILGHEFLHYLHFLSKITRMEIVSDDRIDSIYQAIYEDMTPLLDANIVFGNDNTFLRNIIEKFEYGFQDISLQKKVIQQWIKEDLPITKLTLKDNNIKIPIKSIINFSINSDLKEKLAILDNTNYR
jgi:hypothetical protein